MHGGAFEFVANAAVEMKFLWETGFERKQTDQKRKKKCARQPECEHNVRIRGVRHGLTRFFFFLHNRPFLLLYHVMMITMWTMYSCVLCTVCVHGRNSVDKNGMTIVKKSVSNCWFRLRIANLYSLQLRSLGWHDESSVKCAALGGSTPNTILSRLASHSTYLIFSPFHSFNYATSECVSCMVCGMGRAGARQSVSGGNILITNRILAVAATAFWVHKKWKSVHDHDMTTIDKN